MFIQVNCLPTSNTNIGSLTYSNMYPKIYQKFLFFLMATITTYGSIMPFTLPLEDHGDMWFNEFSYVDGHTLGNNLVAEEQ